MKSRYKIGLFLIIICGVFYAETDEVKSVMEGDSVTLNPDLTNIQGLDLLLWRFGDKGSTIAQIDGNKISYKYYEVFRDRLKLDQTGSLTITNIRSSHSGLYKAEIIHKDGTSNIHQFNVSVYESPSVLAGDEADIKSVSVKEGDSVSLNVSQLQGNDLIVWRFGDEGKLISKHDKETKSSALFDPEERFRDRLKLDQTGSLIITDTRTTDSGLYTVKISSNKQTSYKRFTVSVTEPGLSSAAVAGIVLLLLIMATAAATCVYFYLRKKSELNNQKSKISKRQNETLVISEKLKQMSEISTQLKQMTEDCVKELPGVSEHHQTVRISEKLKEMSVASERLKDLSMCCEKELREISERLKQMSLTKKGETSEQEKPLIEEGMGADDVKQKTTRSEMEKGERERSIFVEETPISLAFGGPRGADGRIRDKQGKSLIVRNTGTEHTGALTRESTGKGVNEETPAISE